MILENFIHHHHHACEPPTPLKPQLGDFFKLNFFVSIFYVINFFIFWLHFDEKPIFSHHSLELETSKTWNSNIILKIFVFFTFKIGTTFESSYDDQSIANSCKMK